MVRINLLKKIIKKKPEQRQIPRKVYVIGGTIVGIVCLAALGWRLVPHFLRREAPKEYTVEENLRPSTYSRAHAVEDVVDESDESGDKLRSGGVLALPYTELSPAEKVNYEIYFAKNVCDLLAEAVPEGIGFRKLSLDNFQKLSGTTLTASRESITQMLKGLRKGNVDPFPRPQSTIRKKGNGYEFQFAAQAEFGLNLRAPFIDLELRHLAARDDIDRTIRTFSQTAAEYGVHINGAPKKLPVESVGRFRKFRYTFKGISSYAQFVRFVSGLHEKRIPCAFEKCMLIAQTPNRLTIDAQLLITAIH